MSTILTPIEEHYLKREVLKIQLDREFEQLNDPHALRKFGFPFTSHDPKDLHKSSSTVNLFNKFRLTSLVQNDPEAAELSKLDIKDDVSNIEKTKFPILSFVLQKFIMTFPLLSKNLVNDETFWQMKVQVFFEHFMSLQFSNSIDREQTTKRKKIAKKLTKIILLLFNSGIGSSLEVQYYNEDKIKIQDDGARERSQIEQFAIPTKQNLRDFLTKEPVFENGWDVNIIAVIEESDLPDGISESKISNEDKNKMSSIPLSPKKATSWAKTFGFSQPKSSGIFSSFSNSDEKVTKGSNMKSSHYYFMIKLRNEESDNKYDDSKTKYTVKTYDEFKALSKALKHEFPGKDLPKLPHKNKKSTHMITSINGYDKKASNMTPKEQIVATFESEENFEVTDNRENRNAIDNILNSDIDQYSDDDSSTESFGDDDKFEDATNSKSNILPFEKLRTSLRQYLRNLTKDNEVISNKIFIEFFNCQNLVDSSFNDKIREDISNRELMDITNLENQIQFQKIALERSMELQNVMTSFKDNFIKDKTFLLSCVREIKKHNKVEDLSPLLRNFIEWCKVYLSSTIYQLFLGNDNSYEFFSQIKRLHRLVPYSVMSQIMKYTNPMAIMKAMMELFMAQPFGGKSLLQTMFSSILADDLKSQDEVIKQLEEKIKKKFQLGEQVIEIFKKSVYNNEKYEYISMSFIYSETEATHMPSAMLLLLHCAEKNYISPEALDIITESYMDWKSINESENDIETIHDEKNKNAELFSNIKELLQLYIKERDKQLLQQLWQDPELIQLLKSMVTMIYEPIVKIFKIARVDIALKNFERFMNDLIKLMDGVINGDLGASAEFNVVEAISDLVTAHQDSFFEFVHDVYNNDTEGVFEGFITWILGINEFLQNSKYGEPTTRIDFSKLLQASSIHTDSVRTEIDNVIDQKLTGRKIYNQLLELKTKETAEKDKKSTNVVDKNWKHINSMVMTDNSFSFGVADGDLLDLDLDTKDYEVLHRNGEDSLEIKYQEILNKTINTDEIKKFAIQDFEKELKEFLKRNGVE
ncbi:hypothetical protein TPHA_0J01100 [Tetrapisispora phaffii CBS 4417]|uniref:PX domain-containing protein n=1 Tax=Tetrapisispora phaffii (strain ATCC 24235 / CBS 4417 / NBRC 1672 / NRRL Y-8282 / UCD 70-5) TaxID=1071381 RepID=G8BYJ0_TETPH|nr:hypothetical protein TPHA_0J01100 [Tetrapisispora phaffii CBS 4417]CCE64932.1 hypothetical protein TPHA_0J01100 [Tetrapisispora phaffii CBS 4417]